MKVTQVTISSDLKLKNGIYIEIGVSTGSKSELHKLVEESKPEHALKVMKESSYHVTIAYSRKVPTGNYKPRNDKYRASIKDLEIWDTMDGYDGKHIIVAKLDSPELEAYWKYLKDTHNLTWDYPDYKPHITLMSGDFDAKDLTDLKSKLVGFKINMEGEKFEDLDDSKADVPD